jgi:serine/threonine protein kinase
MHTARIMHRDVKPANVLIGASGLLKLGDLGLGRQLSQDTVKLLSKVGACCKPIWPLGARHGRTLQMPCTEQLQQRCR